MIAACQPLYGVIPAKAHAAWSDFLCYNMARGLIAGCLSTTNAYIDAARNNLAKRTVDQAEAVLFVDQDMILPLDIIPHLMSVGEEIVGAVYFYKEEPHDPMAFTSWEPLTKMKEFDGTRVQQVASIGMGATLIKTGLLRRMRDTFGDEEWFKSERSGEDQHFCYRCHQMGVPVWLDGRIIADHVGDKVYCIEDYKKCRKL